MRIKLLYLILVLFVLTPLILNAQQSTSFKLEEQTMNSGGNPADGVILASTSFKLSFDAIGDGVVAGGLTGASFILDAGFGSAYPPPGETLNLLFTNTSTLTWNPEKSVGDYNVYRGTTTSLPGTFGTCLTSGLTQETATDNSTPAPGEAFFYLVTSENRLDEEGTKGFVSAGPERTNTSPCP